MRKGIAAVAGTLAALSVATFATISTPASAASATYSLASSTTSTGQKLPMRWNPCQPGITYKVNVSLAGSTSSARAAALADVKKSFDILGSATGMTFTFTGTTSYIPDGRSWSTEQPAEIVVAWVNPTRTKTSSSLLGTDSNGRPVAGTGGYSFKQWAYPGEPWTGAIGRGYVVLNALENKTVRPGFGKGITRGNLLLHELGHVVGLEHVSSTSELMYPVLISRPSAGYHDGDRAGLAKVGMQAGCIDVPSVVWTDL